MMFFKMDNYICIDKHKQIIINLKNITLQLRITSTKINNIYYYDIYTIIIIYI